jgi:site-specific DNA-methyltransferase (adenine-specific)/adenine-specific DNA-methyltransferase
LKALLPYYAGEVKCIYIDPPYNTGNENWIYNDAVNSPEIRAWLGEVVGKEAEDLSRHDKWLCMIYPRLVLLRDMLREDGAIFVTIDDNEVQNLRAVMDEVFGKRNFVTSIIWHKNYAPKSTAKHFSEDHDYILVYARNGDKWRPGLLPRTEKQDRVYKNPDNDPRGPWRPNNLAARNFYSKGVYAIRCPGGRVIPGPPKGSYWRVSEDTLWDMDKEGRIYWGPDRNNVPAPKIYLSEVKQGIVPQTIWSWQEVGHTQEAKKELVAICDFEDSASVFITPKPVRLIKRILEIATYKDSLVLDSFAGSGTTGHAVLAKNKEDGGNRRFVMVEMDENISRKIAAQRLSRAIAGYTPRSEQGKKRIDGIGGGFRYCTLDEPLFDEKGHVCKEVKFNDLARHVFFVETGEPLPKGTNGKRSPLIGVCNGTAYYLLFNGVLGDRRSDGGNVLTGDVLARLPKHEGPRVVFGEGCSLGPARLKREGVRFKQIPYEIKVS